MNPKLLTENGWKAIAAKFKVKDNGLQRALSSFEKLEDDEFADRLKGIASAIQLAGALKKVKEVIALPDVVKYLTNVLAAAQTEQREITKAKAEAEKAKALAAKTAAVTQKKAEAEAKKLEQEEDKEAEGGDEEEEEEQGDYREKLKTAYKRLKSSKELVYNFIVCDAKPQCGLIITKVRINAKHKTDLTKITGSKRFLKPGTCYVDGGKLVLDMVKPPPGLAAKLKKSFKYLTGITVGFIIGDQSDEDEEEQPSADVEASTAEAGGASRPGQPAAGEQEAEQTQAGEPPAEAPETGEQEELPSGDAASRSGRPTLAQAPEVWQQTQRDISAGIEQLKAAIRKEFADEGPELAAEIDQKMEKLDGILDTLDAKLSSSLTKANGAANPTARANELKNTKTILANYINFVKSEPLIAQIDSNPFGVKINLKKRLTDTLAHVAQAIGR